MTKYADILEAVNLKIDELKSLFGPQLVEINKTLDENKLVFKANEERFARIEKSIKSNEVKLSALKEDIKKKDDIISQLGCSVTSLKDAYRYAINKLNYYEQRPRSYTAKFHNLATSSSLSNLDLQRFVWDTFCVPTFALAKKDGRIKSLRKFETSIDTGHFLGQGRSYADKLKDVPNSTEGVATDEVPADDSDNLPAAGRNFLLRFNNRNDKTVFMCYKRTIIEDYNKTNNSKVRVGEDLTGNNRNIMNLLCSDKFPEVGKNVRIRNSKVQYALESDKKAWKTVHNVFAATLEEMSKELSEPVEELFNKSVKKT